jgi:hypothetical protein
MLQVGSGIFSAIIGHFVKVLDKAQTGAIRRALAQTPVDIVRRINP